MHLTATYNINKIRHRCGDIQQEVVMFTVLMGGKKHVHTSCGVTHEM